LKVSRAALADLVGGVISGRAEGLAGTGLVDGEAGGCATDGGGGLRDGEWERVLGHAWGSIWW